MVNWKPPIIEVRIRGVACAEGARVIGSGAMRSPQTRAGFTKTELLVSIFVVFVIMCLVGFLVPGSMVSRAGRMSEAKCDLTQLCEATKAFYTDYGYYPVDPKIHWNGNAVYGLPGGTRHNSDLVNVLMADGTNPGPNFGNALNPHQVIYLDVPDIKNPSEPKEGLGTGKETNPYGVTAPHEWYDPYGTPYIVFIDATHLGYCDAGMIYSDVSGPAAQPRVGVAAVSLGADKQYGKGGDRVYEGSDDVDSWR